MKCINKKIGKLITRYQMGMISDEEKKLFEAHLLDCDACFHDYYEIAPVIEEIRAQPEYYLAALKEEESSKLQNWLTKVGNIVERLVHPIPKQIRIALPTVVTAVILILILLPSGAQYSHLAKIEPVYYKQMVTRAPHKLSQAERLFKEGMEFYKRGDYTNAIENLNAARIQNPNDANIHFYLGLCYLLKDDKSPEIAIKHFRETLNLGGNSLAEKCHWYLGNAYLLKDKGKKALEEFQKVVAMEGDYEWEARDLIVKIERLRK